MRKGKQSSTLLSRLFATIKAVFVCLCLYLSLIGVRQLDLAHAFPFTNVKIYGAHALSHEELQRIVLPFLHHGFFTISIEALHDRLLQNPWISRVVVRRKWPDELTILLEERVPIARWNKATLLSTRGELFVPEEMTSDLHKASYQALPSLIGPLNQHVLMLGYFQNINRLLQTIHVRIRELDLNAHATWKLTLDNGIVLYIGYKDVLTRVGQFAKVYPKLLNEEKGVIASVDLRYPNGMAVQWADRK